MPRTVGLIAFSYERKEEEEETSQRNLALAIETEKVAQRFFKDNCEENNLKILMIAEREIADILNEERGIEVDMPIGWATLNETPTPRRLAKQATIFLKNSNAKEVIIVAPFWKLGRFRHLFKKLGFIPIKMKIRRIGFWPSAPNWWRNTSIRMLFRNLIKPFFF